MMYLLAGDAVDDLLDVFGVDGVVFVEVVDSEGVLSLGCYTELVLVD